MNYQTCRTYIKLVNRTYKSFMQNHHDWFGYLVNDIFARVGVNVRN